MHIAGKRSRTGGNFILEFALVAPLLMILLGGTFEVGMALNKGSQVSTVCRNANVLVIGGIDLSQMQNQQLLMRTAAGLGMNQSASWSPDPSGNGVVLLTKVYRVGPLECAVGINNWDGRPSSCPNYGNYVIASRVTIGNGSRWTSPIGTPATAGQANGNLYDSDIAGNPGNAAQGFPAVIALNLDQYANVSEVYADISSFTLFSIVRSPVIYMRNLS